MDPVSPLPPSPPLPRSSSATAERVELKNWHRRVRSRAAAASTSNGYASSSSSSSSRSASRAIALPALSHHAPTCARKSRMSSERSAAPPRRLAELRAQQVYSHS